MRIGLRPWELFELSSLSPQVRVSGGPGCPKRSSDQQQRKRIQADRAVSPELPPNAEVVEPSGADRLCSRVESRALGSFRA
jgi:hypothetical protein